MKNDMPFEKCLEVLLAPDVQREGFNGKHSDALARIRASGRTRTAVKRLVAVVQSEVRRREDIDRQFYAAEALVDLDAVRAIPAIFEYGRDPLALNLDASCVALDGIHDLIMIAGRPAVTLALAQMRTLTRGSASAADRVYWWWMLPIFRTPKAKAALPYLLKHLAAAKGDPALQARLIDVIGSLESAAESAVRTIFKHVRSRDWRVRYAALETLKDIGVRDEKGVASLLELCRSSCRGVRRRARIALASSGYDGRPAYELFLRYVKAKDTWVGRSARWYLGSLGQRHPWVVRALIAEFTQATDLRIKLSLAQVLGNMGRHAGEALPPLKALLPRLTVRTESRTVSFAISKIEQAIERHERPPKPCRCKTFCLCWLSKKGAEATDANR